MTGIEYVLDQLNPNALQGVAAGALCVLAYLLGYSHGNDATPAEELLNDSAEKLARR